MRKVAIEREARVLDDYFSVDEAYFSYELFSGGMSPRTRRLNFDRGDSVAAIIVNRDTHHVLLIEQFRYPAYKKGTGWLIETVAGILQPGETAETAVRREVREEVGFEIEQLSFIGKFYLSPGGSSERVTLFLAEVSSSSKVVPGGGVPEEGEDIRMVEYPLSQLRAQLATGQIQDAKTLLGCMWLLDHEASRSVNLSFGTPADG